MKRLRTNFILFGAGLTLIDRNYHMKSFLTSEQVRNVHILFVQNRNEPASSSKDFFFEGEESGAARLGNNSIIEANYVSDNPLISKRRSQHRLT